MPFKNKRDRSAYNKNYALTHSERIKENYYKRRRTHPEKTMLSDARKRAKNKGLEFSITAKDIHIPEVCPIFGIKLEQSCGRPKDNSPSLDRLDSSKGYIPGNVVVISYRANHIKNNGTADEHRRIADFMSSYGYY